MSAFDKVYQVGQGMGAAIVTNRIEVSGLIGYIVARAARGRYGRNRIPPQGNDRRHLRKAVGLLRFKRSLRRA